MSYRAGPGYRFSTCEDLNSCIVRSLFRVGVIGPERYCEVHDSFYIGEMWKRLSGNVKSSRANCEAARLLIAKTISSSSATFSQKGYSGRCWEQIEALFLVAYAFIFYLEKTHRCSFELKLWLCMESTTLLSPTGDQGLSVSCSMAAGTRHLRLWTLELWAQLASRVQYSLASAIWEGHLRVLCLCCILLG